MTISSIFLKSRLSEEWDRAIRSNGWVQCQPSEAEELKKWVESSGFSIVLEQTEIAYDVRFFDPFNDDRDVRKKLFLAPFLQPVDGDRADQVLQTSLSLSSSYLAKALLAVFVSKGFLEREAGGQISVPNARRDSLRGITLEELMLINRGIISLSIVQDLGLTSEIEPERYGQESGYIFDWELAGLDQAGLYRLRRYADDNVLNIQRLANDEWGIVDATNILPVLKLAISRHSELNWIVHESGIQIGSPSETTLDKMETEAVGMIENIDKQIAEAREQYSSAESKIDQLWEQEEIEGTKSDEMDSQVTKLYPRLFVYNSLHEKLK